MTVILLADQGKAFHQNGGGRGDGDTSLKPAGRGTGQHIASGTPRRGRRRAEELGATLLYDRTDDNGEPLYVLADPAGHPFFLLVGSE
jgi:hypothetical protein